MYLYRHRLTGDYVVSCSYEHMQSIENTGGGHICVCSICMQYVGQWERLGHAYTHVYVQLR